MQRLFSFGLLDLTDKTLIAVSPGRPLLLRCGQRLTELVAETDVTSVAGLLASGSLAGYQARCLLRGANGQQVAVDLWIRALTDATAPRCGLLLVRSEVPPGAVGLPRSYQPPHLPSVALGTLGEDARVQLLSTELEDLTGYALRELVQRSILELLTGSSRAAARAALALAQDRRTFASASAALETPRGPLSINVAFVPLTGNARHRACFFVSPRTEEVPPAPPDRILELESALARIGEELAALHPLTERHALAPESAGVLEQLSPRQQEIALQLLAGKRVPSIARSLYLSPSTVRNHLSAVCRRFGVHSQAQFLDAYRRRERR